MPNTIFNQENIKKHSIPITKLEKDILKLLCNQKDLKETAKTLGVSTHTIHAYKISILQKFQCKNIQNLKNYCI